MNFDPAEPDAGFIFEQAIDDKFKFRPDTEANAKDPKVDYGSGSYEVDARGQGAPISRSTDAENLKNFAMHEKKLPGAVLPPGRRRERRGAGSPRLPGGPRGPRWRYKAAPAMSETTLERIEKTLADTRDAVSQAFSGKDRLAMDPNAFDPFIETLKRALADLDALGALTASDSSARLRANLEGQIAVLTRDKGLTRVAREMGPGFDRFAVEGAAANFVFDRYGRHFAGQSRDTRDAGLLHELVTELTGIKKRMLAAGKKLPDTLQNDVDLVQSNIDRYAAEEREITTALTAGTPDERADRLAFLANQQFALYQTFFAGQSRMTRRPALLKRMIENLTRYRTGMFDLKTRGLEYRNSN